MFIAVFVPKQVAQFNISSEEARLTIQDGTFSLVATQVGKRGEGPKH